jgi:hypothetical protein
MSTTGISLLQSHEQGIAWRTPHHCHAMHSPADAIRGGVWTSARPRARECNTPAGFRRGDGPQVARGDHAPSVARAGGDAARMLPGFDVSS